MNLEEIREAIQNDFENEVFSNQGWQPVYTAHKDARILIVGQAPGRKAQETGVPWNDMSGDNLRAWMGIHRDDFYNKQKIALVPMDFYFPGTLARGDAPPRKGFAEKWHPLILENLKNIKLTLLIGQYAQAFYLPGKTKKTLTETVCSYKEYLPSQFPLVHPSPRNNIWHKKNPWFKNEVVDALKTRVSKSL